MSVAERCGVVASRKRPESLIWKKKMSVAERCGVVAYRSVENIKKHLLQRDAVLLHPGNISSP